MIRILTSLSAALFLSLPVAASAHPGHGHTDHHPVAHHLIEPEHAFALAAVIVTVLAIVVIRRSAAARRRE